jgi:hypothetical protein
VQVRPQARRCRDRKVASRVGDARPAKLKRGEAAVEFEEQESEEWVAPDQRRRCGWVGRGVIFGVDEVHC